MTGDTFGWSPDIGSYVRREGQVYTEHGAIHHGNAMFRSMGEKPTQEEGKENYADWTVEQREAVKNRLHAQQAQEDLHQSLKEQARDLLVASGKAKLTEEEFEAIVDQTADNSR